jgi:hypothetical protein
MRLVARPLALRDAILAAIASILTRFLIILADVITEGMISTGATLVGATNLEIGANNTFLTTRIRNVFRKIRHIYFILQKSRQAFCVATRFWTRFHIEHASLASSDQSEDHNKIHCFAEPVCS